jgi:hypothetical protein
MLPCISNILRSFGFLVATACNRLIRKREEVRPHNRKQNYLSAVNRFESDRTAEAIRGQGNAPGSGAPLQSYVDSTLG